MGITTWLRRHQTPGATTELRQRCEALLADLDVPDPFDLDVFVDRVATSRGRPVTLVPYPMTGNGAPCGMWVALEEADVIFVDSATGGAQRANIVAHELGHLVADHASDPSLTPVSDDVAGPLLPLLDPTMIRRVLGRTSYTTQEEQEAEVFAWLLLGERSWRTTWTCGSTASSTPTSPRVDRTRRLFE